MRERADWILRGAREIATMAPGGIGSRAPRSGAALRDVGLLTGGGIAIRGDRILAVAPEAEILARFDAPSEQVVDLGGDIVLPGFVDPHTHLLFAGSRAGEFQMRCEGKSYQEIAAEGGGIRSSVRAFRGASDETLFEESARRLDRLLANGTTTVEVKSGYGLSLEQELRALHLIGRLDDEHPVDCIPTFLGAHEFPDEYRDDREAYVRLIVDDMLPLVRDTTRARFCDVFCEDKVFTAAQSREILLAAARHGLALKLHADEFEPIGGAELAGELHAVSADHLMAAAEPGLRSLKAGGVLAVLLPATSFSLAKGRYAPARRMIELGIPVALATDCNPGSSLTESMPLVLSLACLQMGLHPAEAMNAATVNAAFACGVGEDRGQLAPGFRADLQILQAPSWLTVIQSLGESSVRWVMKDGRPFLPPRATGAPPIPLPPAR